MPAKDEATSVVLAHDVDANPPTTETILKGTPPSESTLHGLASLPNRLEV